MSKSNYSLDHHALALVAGAQCASRNEILDAAQYLETKIIGTGYYDGVGDELLKQIIVYLKEASK